MATTQDPLAASTSGSSSTVSSVKERLNDAATQIRQTASDYGRTAADQIDRNVKSAAGALHTTAEKLRSQAGTSEGGKVSDIAQNAAGKLDATASALQNFDTRQALAQFEGWTRQNPGIAIGGALAIGFFLGMTLRSDSDRSSTSAYSSKYDY